MDVQESPGVSAANNIAAYRTRVLEALDSGRTEAAMRAVSLQDWKTATANRGASNLSTAVNDPQVQAKMQRALAIILPFTQQVKDTIRRMPNATKEDRKARMMKAFDMMSTLRVKQA